MYEPLYRWMKTMNGNQVTQNVPHTFINCNIQNAWAKQALFAVLYINVFVVAFYIKPHVSKHLQAENMTPLLLSWIRKIC